MSPAAASDRDSTVSLAATALRRKLVSYALASREFRRSLEEAAAEIRGAARPEATEATIEGYFERVLYALLRDIGLKFHPEKEVRVDLRRHLTRGRMDSRLGALVIEYKRPALLKSPAQVAKALDQLSQYLIALSRESEGQIAGILTDGQMVAELRAANGAIIQQSALQRLDADALLRLTQSFISLALTALTSTNLIRDFCGSETDGVLFRVARLLDNLLAADTRPKTAMLRSEWEQMFRLAHEDQSQQRRIEDRRVALGKLFDVVIPDAAVEYRTLFALHTAYAILLKLIAYRVVSDVYLRRVPQDFRSLARATPTALRGICSRLEDGEIFRDLGIVNLLEGDFFSWYCDREQWTPALAESIREMLAILARYEEAARIFDSGQVHDLFRELYQAAVPRVVRSSFGEFYTPYWLAESVLDAAAPSDDWRAIDPCCGSGTFIMAAIDRLKKGAAGLDPRLLLDQILRRVVAIDLNPLAVLTSRIHYFIYISELLPAASGPVVIPVYLGDAASVPERRDVDGVACLYYRLATLRTPIDAILPVSLIRDTPRFMQAMLRYEQCIKSNEGDAAPKLLLAEIPKHERTPRVVQEIERLTAELLSLEQNGWNGIWARILSNFLTTACLGTFTAVVGNPPWIDWKNLPAGYRERIKGLCIDRGLFSGAGRTGGINLNICALIAYVSMSNWLDPKGRLAFLMPKELVNQASYEGWRRLGGKWHFREFHDWSNAGDPFDPVKEDFLTFVVAKGPAPAGPVPVLQFEKRGRSKASAWRDTREAAAHLDVTSHVAGQIIPGSTAYTFANTVEELRAFAAIAGECEYIGREGVEFYPQELLLFTFEALGPRPGTVWLRNLQVTKSKYRIPSRRILLETRYLHPLVKGPEINLFGHDYSGIIVAFPYDAADPIRPIPADRLKKTSPLLLQYYLQNREIMEQQTKFSDKIRGADPGEFYGLARTGPYSFADAYVGFRDNTKWRSCVVGSTEMPWGEVKRFVFQNHAVSMCERRGEGGFISTDETHFVCAILNAPIVERFIGASSDFRSFKIRPPVFVPPYDPKEKIHRDLVAVSRAAHADSHVVDWARREAEKLYLRLCDGRAPGLPGDPEAATELFIYATSRAMIARRLEAAEVDVREGRTLGPFTSAEDLMRAVKRTSARSHH